MANEEHLSILRQGVEVWNRWRQEHPDVRPDIQNVDLSRATLRGANLRGADLSFADLSCARLRGADLSDANLNHADLSDGDLLGADLLRASLFRAGLSRADLSRADLSRADLSSADLSSADLGGANLNRANLSDADLSRARLSAAYLIQTNLNGADLIQTNLRGAHLGLTVFFGTNLTGMNGLDECLHLGPSTVDHSTLAKSGSLPKEFLQGCGLPDWLIEAYKLTQSGLKPQQVNDIVYKIFDAHTSNPIQFYSCFISYSHADKAFARTLHDVLQAKGIRCWLDEHQILPGDDLRDEIDRGINLWDKILLLCSESSLESYWVNTEIDKALKKEERLWKERKKKTLALIPLNLDGYLFTWNNSRASTLTDRHAEDLVDADKEPDKLEDALARIEKALRSDPGAREAPPEPKL